MIPEAKHDPPSDDAVESILSALGTEAPDAEFERRLLLSLAQRRVEGALPRGTAPRGIRWRTWWPALACLLLLATGGVGFLRSRYPAAPSGGQIASLAKTGLVRNGSGGPLSTGVPRTPTKRQAGPSPAAVKAPALERLRRMPKAADALLVAVSGPQTEVDQKAMDDLRAPSQPAPMMPPTAQERLVRLMLRHGERRELAGLDRTETDRVDAAEQHSFHTFFDPEPSPELALELKKGNTR